MDFIKRITKIGFKLWKLTGRVETNATNIEKNTHSVKALKQQLLKLTNYAKQLENQLKIERERNKNLQEKHQLELKSLQEKNQFEIEKYRSENKQFKTEMELNLEKFKNTLLKEDLNRSRLLDTTNSLGYSNQENTSEYK